MRPTFRERWVTAGGLRLCTEEHGEGPPILLAHGMWCEAGMFAGVAQDLARDHHVIVPDLRGHGRSEAPDAPWSTADLADDLIAMLDALRLERVTLAGFSMGGMAAAALAARHPERLSQLALLSTSGAAEHPFRRLQIRALATLIEKTGPPRFLAAEAASSAFSRRFRRDHPLEVNRWECAIRAMDRTALVHALRAVGDRPDLLPRLGALQIPVLILTGTADHVLHSRWSKAMHRAIPGSHLVTLEGAAHAVPIERPEAVATLLRNLAAGRLTAAA